jgi:predicted CoA-binding protein
MVSIENVLENSKTIVIIGLSNKPDRPSYQVAEYLISQGFKIIPVNPMINSVLGLKSYKSIKEIPKEINIDIVDIFRKSEEVLLIVEEIISSNRKPIIWFQEGIINLDAENLAKENGLEVINGICLMKAYQNKLPIKKIYKPTK